MILSIMFNVLCLSVGIHLGRNYLRKEIKVKEFDGFKYAKRRINGVK